MLQAELTMADTEQEEWLSLLATARLLNVAPSTLKGGPRYVPPIQRREVRLAALNERWRKLLSIMDERGESEEAQAIPGGSSALLISPPVTRGGPASRGSPPSWRTTLR